MCVYFFVDNGNNYIDAISSWWVTLHGHCNPYISKKVSEQLVQLEHSIFSDFTHGPAVTLAERLLQHLAKNQSKIFYSDNGSTAVEVALKMTLQYWHNQKINKTLFFFGYQPHSSLICNGVFMGRLLFPASISSPITDIYLSFNSNRWPITRILISWFWSQCLKIDWWAKLSDLPIVGMWLTGNESSANRNSRQVFPTLESPMMINLSKWSYPPAF